MPPARLKQPSSEPPEGWENFEWLSFTKISLKHNAWFARLSKKTPNEIDWRPASPRGVTGKDKYAAYVLLYAQVRHWRQKAKDLEECLTDAGVESTIPKSVWSAIEQHISRIKKAEQKSPKFGGYLTESYDWCAATHRGTQLRVALGYRANAFQKLRRSAKIRAGERGGSGRHFTFKEAVKLLHARLLRTRPSIEIRKRIASEIWETLKSCSGSHRIPLRKVLRSVGAECLDSPQATFLSPTALNLFSQPS